MVNEIKKTLRKLKNPQKADVLSRFFKTGKGGYGEGDVFLGIPVPEQRKVAKQYSSLPLTDLQSLLSSQYHEHRFTALLILMIRYGKSDLWDKQEIYYFYLNHINHINSWDLVDISAGPIMGNYLLQRDKAILYELARSPSLWERRIAVMATFEFIKNNQFKDTLRISELLLQDTHDLIQKAVGWMLREVGKRHLETEEFFLKKHYKRMPRTMLRYAIERLPEPKRLAYLKGNI